MFFFYSYIATEDIFSPLLKTYINYLILILEWSEKWEVIGYLSCLTLVLVKTNYFMYCLSFIFLWLFDSPLYDFCSYFYWPAHLKHLIHKSFFMLWTLALCHISWIYSLKFILHFLNLFIVVLCKILHNQFHPFFDLVFSHFHVMLLKNPSVIINYKKNVSSIECLLWTGYTMTWRKRDKDE